MRYKAKCRGNYWQVVDTKLKLIEGNQLSEKKAKRIAKTMNNRTTKNLVRWYVQKYKDKMSNSLPSSTLWWIDGISGLSESTKRKIYIELDEYIDHESRDRALEHSDFPKWATDLVKTTIT